MYSTDISLATHGEGDIVDLTPQVSSAVAASGMKDGLVSLFVTGSTVALTTIEFEPGVLSDLKRALAVLAPADIPYEHDRAWGDGNGRSHVRAALVGPSLAIPFRNGSLLAGTWQQIVLLELDVRSARRRTVHVTVIGS